MIGNESALIRALRAMGVTAIGHTRSGYPIYYTPREAGSGNPAIGGKPQEIAMLPAKKGV